MKLVNIHLYTAPSKPSNYLYKIEISLNGTWKLMHTGKFFANTGEQDIQLDLQDVFINYRYEGVQSLKPVADTTNNQYQMPSTQAGLLSECYYNQIRVVSLDSPTKFSTVSKYFWFIPTDAFGYSFNMPSGLVTPATADGLIPHVPANAPAGFNFSSLLYNNSNSTINATYRRDNTVVGTVSIAAHTAQHRPLAGATEGYYINDIKVVDVDECMHPYYLVWMQNNGGLQCQPFLKSSKFSVNYTNNNAIDIRNAEWKINSTAEGQWGLKSRNLSEAEYKLYGEMFNSPYLVLLDMDNSRLHYVNISKTTYEEKQRTRNDRKPIFFEVELKSADKVRI